MRRVLRRRSESGVSLVELIVVLAMMSVVSVLVYGVLIGTTRVAARADNSTRAENNGRLALRTVSEDVRAAVQIRASSSTTACASGLTYPAGFASCVGFLVPHGITVNATTTTIAPGATPIACPYSNITYGLKAGVLREDRTDYNASCTATSTTLGRVILADVDNSSAQALFAFYDDFGNQLAPTNTVADFVKAGSVLIQLYLNYQKGAPDISLQTTAALRNGR
jgi:prepilin-type N-terminal cleavage/methylation domain-containing protein